MRILVVEDERIIALALSHVIKTSGHEVLACVPSGEEALAALEHTAADLVLLDIRLEGELDGVETAKRIVERYGTRVAFTSASSDLATQGRIQTLNPVAILTKPVLGSELRALMDTIATGNTLGDPS